MQRNLVAQRPRLGARESPDPIPQGGRSSIHLARLLVRGLSHPIPVTNVFSPKLLGGKSPRPTGRAGRRRDTRRRDTRDACAEEPASLPLGPSVRKGNNTRSERPAGQAGEPRHASARAPTPERGPTRVAGSATGAQPSPRERAGARHHRSR